MLLRIKKARGIKWHDLPKIESPFFARSYVKNGFYGFDEIWGLDEVLRDITHSIYPRKDKYELSQLLNMLREGRIFLLKDKPFSPVVKWVESNNDEWYWEVNSSLDIFVKSSIKHIIRTTINPKSFSYGHIIKKEPQKEPPLKSWQGYEAEQKTLEQKELEKGSLKVTVVNKCDNNPIKDALIYVAHQNQATNSKGEVIFSELPVNSYRVKVKKNFPEANYQIQSKYDWLLIDKVGQLKEAKSIKNIFMVKVEKDKTNETEAKIEVYRLIEKIVFKRINPTLQGVGHWWVVIDDKESYGWYPAHYEEVNAPPRKPIPPPTYKGTLSDPISYVKADTYNFFGKIKYGFEKIGYAVDQALYSVKKAFHGIKTVMPGIKGSLNKGEIVDIYHDYDGHNEYQPVVNGEETDKECWTDKKFKNCVKNFAKSYTGKYGILPARQCHTFQLEIIKHCCLEKLKRLK